MFRRASLGFFMALVLVSAPGRAAYGQLTCGDWVCFEDVTSTNLIFNDSPADGANDEMDAAAGDVDNDGDVDLVIVYKQLGTTVGKKRNFLMLNEGGVLVDHTAEFASASDIPGDQGFLTQTNDRDVALCDVTGDGWLDIITATTRSGGAGGTAGTKHISHPRIYINLGNDGEDNWLGYIFDDEDRVPTMPAEPRFCSVSCADFDNDGDVDTYWGDYQQPEGTRPVDINDRLWINDGNGYFTDETLGRMTTEMVESSFAMATVAADMNGDGRIDILKDDALNAPQGVSISYNNVNNSTGQDGEFTHYDIPYLNAPYHINTGDLNRDGLLDIVVTDDGADSYIRQTGVGGDGLSNFTGRIQLTGAPGQFDGNNLIADLNNDQWGDILIANMDVDLPDFSCTQRGRIYHNSGGTIGGAVNIAYDGNLGIELDAYRGGHDFIAEDFNGDGWLDLFVGSCHGTWLYFNQPPLGIDVAFPNGQPTLLTPEQPYTLDFDVSPFGGDLAADGVRLMVSVDGGAFTSAAVTQLGGSSYQGDLPAADCESSLDYYIEVEFESGSTFTEPSGAPANAFSAAAFISQLVYQETVESDTSEWSIVDDPGLTAGTWEPADPIGSLSGFSEAAPFEPAEGTMAFVTQQCAVDPCTNAGTADIDGGGTELISQSFDLDGSDADISYFVWFFGQGTNNDLTVWVTNDADEISPNWVLVENVDETNNAWRESGFRVSDFVTPTAEVAIRFRAEELTPSTLVEAGVDDVRVNELVCEACSSNHCCDLDGNSIRDDGCVWCECDNTPCNILLQQIPITYADMGGPNGNCLPDGVADANDRFHALNCFSNINTSGAPPYDCEQDSPTAYNVDAAGFEMPCSPDGVCDANDAFAALNAFEGNTPCSCGPMPNAPLDRQITGQASITLQTAAARTRAGGFIEVDAVMNSPLKDLRGYQLHVGVQGGTHGNLELVDILIQDRDGAAFADAGAWTGFNVETSQMLAGLDGNGLATEPGAYLATFLFRASKDAAGTFMIDLQNRTFLFGSQSAVLRLAEVVPATITIGERMDRRAGAR